MKDDLKRITEQLEEGVRAVFADGRFTEYLQLMSKFTDYSFNNCLLILMQKPDATLCAGYKAWQTKFNRQVLKGEKGIKILAPCPHKKEVEDADGNIKEVVWTSFRAVSIFDITQTTGEDLPTCPVQTLTGTVEEYEDLLHKLESISPVPVAYEAIKGSANGYFSSAEKRIVVKKDMPEMQTIKTLLHEIAHAVLHDKDTGTDTDADKLTREVEAESTAYCVCSMLGIDTSSYSFGYIASWSSNKEVAELTESMETIRITARDIFDRLAA